jgi:beta-fructofuranosidase
MYINPSMIGSEIGDHDVTTVDGRIHLHHLCLPNHDVVAHAISEDGLLFTPAPAALSTGDPGACDDDMIWTMHTVRHPKSGLYMMYYTACSLAEGGQVQRVALATSTDFIHWEKHPGNPVLTAAAPHYVDTLDDLGRVPFRDPFVFIEDDGVMHMLICAQTAHGDRLRRGCVAHAISTDGFAWELLPPLYAPGQFDDLETPALLKLEGRYYLFLKEFRGPRTFYRVADSLAGPWRTPEWDEPLPPDNAVMRFCEWEGRTLAYTWFRCKPDWPFRGPALHAILPPKEVQVRPDGRLRCGSFHGWSARHAGPAVALPPASWQPLETQGGAWRVAEHRLEGEAAGLGVVAVPEQAADFIFELNACCVRGRSIGLIFRADDVLERGNWIRLDFERRRVELHRLQPMETGLNRFVRMQPSLKQQWDFPLERGAPMRLRLLASREYIEFSIDGQVCLSLVDYARTSGRLGLFLEDAGGWFREMRCQSIVPTAADAGIADAPLEHGY